MDPVAQEVIIKMRMKFGVRTKGAPLARTVFVQLPCASWFKCNQTTRGPSQMRLGLSVTEA